MRERNAGPIGDRAIARNTKHRFMRLRPVYGFHQGAVGQHGRYGRQDQGSRSLLGHLLDGMFGCVQWLEGHAFKTSASARSRKDGKFAAMAKAIPALDLFSR